MKRYSISRNESKTNKPKYCYCGRTDDWKEYVNHWDWLYKKGYQIKDSITGKIVYRKEVRLNENS